MQYIYIDRMGEHDYEKYLDKISTLDTGQELTVVIHTNGGDNELCDILSEELYKFKIHIKAFSTKSAGMILLDRLHKNALSVTISEYSIYMVHLPARDVSIGMGGKVSRGDFEKHSYSLMVNTPPYKFNILTKEEEERYLNGEDVFIMPDRVKKYYSKSIG